MEYKICSRCIMDTSDTQITFDSDGVCNHCLRYCELKRFRGLYRKKLRAEEMQGVNKQDPFERQERLTTIALSVLVVVWIVHMWHILQKSSGLDR